VAAVLSIVVKEVIYWYTYFAAKKINSSALMASAWHSRSDALSSIGSFAGILGARMGFPVLDPVASLFICAFILKAAFDIFKDAIKKMMDTACDDDFVGEVRTIVLGHEKVTRIDHLHTRLFGDKAYVDLEICADGHSTLFEAHAIAKSIHNAIEARFPQVKHCLVHVSPDNEAPEAVHDEDGADNSQ